MTKFPGKKIKLIKIKKEKQNINRNIFPISTSLVLFTLPTASILLNVFKIIERINVS